MHWDIYSRVVDNFGDVGFGWRLATDLAARGEEVRFRLDDRRALDWLAPRGHFGVECGTWADAGTAGTPADVVVETFGCGLPAACLASMKASRRPPVWIDVEYLSAQAYVERSHGLPSPQADGLIRWFFYPGYTAATGGLLREPDLAERQRNFLRPQWLRAFGRDREVVAQCAVRVVSLFCYETPALASMFDELAAEPTLLLAAAGRASRQVEDALGPSLARGGLTALLLPRLTQRDYDHLLWASDLNFVRGEDSFVRAQWAGVPFVWQIYPQDDHAHVAKLDSFLDRFLAGAPASLAPQVRSVFRAWNGLAPFAGWPDPAAWRAHCVAWRASLCAQADLGTRLVSWAASKMLK